jgi:hypothetical protein
MLASPAVSFGTGALLLVGGYTSQRSASASDMHRMSLMHSDPDRHQVGSFGKSLGTICVANSLKTRTCRGR